MMTRRNGDAGEPGDTQGGPGTPRPRQPAVPARPKGEAAGTGTNYFCPICGYEFLPEEIGRKPYCRRCGYLES